MKDAFYDCVSLCICFVTELESNVLASCTNESFQYWLFIFILWTNLALNGDPIRLYPPLPTKRIYLDKTFHLTFLHSWV